MGVNAAAFVRYFLHAEEKKAWNFIPPVLGFVICLALWLSLSRPAQIVGSIWMIAGIVFGIWKTRGFREPLSFDVPAEGECAKSKINGRRLKPLGCAHRSSG